MQYTFLELRILTLFVSKEYKECLCLLEQMYKNIIIDKNRNRNRMIWTYYYYKSNILTKQLKNNLALTNILKCFKYLKYKDSEDTNYKKSLNLLAFIYKKLKYEKKSILIYDYLLILTKDKKIQMLLSYNIYKLKNNQKNKLKYIENDYKNQYNSLIEEDIESYNNF